MRFVMLTFVAEEGAQLYEGETDEERRAMREEHMQWFQRHAEAVRGGYELSWPRVAGRVSGERRASILDGPFAETKEVIGGIVVLDAPSLQAALDMAAEWPSLGHYPGARVEVIAVQPSDA